jgi:hypothetical protein
MAPTDTNIKYGHGSHAGLHCWWLGLVGWWASRQLPIENGEPTWSYELSLINSLPWEMVHL